MEKIYSTCAQEKGRSNTLAGMKYTFTNYHELKYKKIDTRVADEGRWYSTCKVCGSRLVYSQMSKDVKNDYLVIFINKGINAACINKSWLYITVVNAKKNIPSRKRESYENGRD